MCVCVGSVCVWGGELADLRCQRGLVVEQHLAERLLLALVHIGKAEHFFRVGRRKRQEGLIPWEERRLLPGDQQYTEPGEGGKDISVAQEQEMWTSEMVD